MSSAISALLPTPGHPQDTPSPESASPAPPVLTVPKISREELPPRRSSFAFLKRSKSTDPLSNRSVSGSKMNRKQKALFEEDELRKQREAAAVSKRPPRIPSYSPFPAIHTFGGESTRPDSVAIISNRTNNYSRVSSFSRPFMSSIPSTPLSNIPMPSIPGSSPANRNGEYVDPYEKSESMTHRSRYSYASSAAVSNINSPRRIRRRKDPTPFNIMVIGAKNCGKTSFINFLSTSLALPPHKRVQTSPPPRTTEHAHSAFTSHYLEAEIDNERIGVTLWDSPGLEKNIVDLQLREMATFLESKFEDTFTEEQKVVRAPGVRDTHVHCVFLILDPNRLDSTIASSRRHTNGKYGNDRPRISGGLDEHLDLQVLKALQGKTTVIPVISKADTITTVHMAYLKKTLWESLKQAKLDPLEALGLDDDSSSDSGSMDERDVDDVQRPGTSDKHDDSDIINDLFDRSESDESQNSLESPATTPSPMQVAKDTHQPLSSHQRSSSTMSLTIGSAAINPTGDELPDLPLSIISPDIYDPDTIGRRFPWGFADPLNASHCDFTRLKESVFSEWRAELRDASRQKWYESWRTSRLKRTPQRMRVPGGVTPTRVIPKEGRTSPAGSRSFSGASRSISGNGGLGSGVTGSPTLYRSLTAYQ
ncbi:hypothetical protein BJ546DRAFT_109431 [Cryomyces antarcticus]